MSEQGRYIATEFGPIWQAGKPQKRAGENPHSRLKHKCRAAVTKWRQELNIPVVLLPSFVGTVTTDTGREVRLGKKGQADDCWLLLGQAVLAEYKSGAGEQTPDQKRHEERVRATGNTYVLVRTPNDLTDALTQIAAQRGRIF